MVELDNDSPDREFRHHRLLRLDVQRAHENPDEARYAIMTENFGFCLTGRELAQLGDWISEIFRSEILKD